MNILRKSRKNRIKFDKRRFVLLIFTLIMTTFAWITYSKILLPNLKIHINSWNIAIYVDDNKNGVAEDDEKVANKVDPIVIEPFEVYPGMNQDVIEVLIKNNGEIPSIINYDITGAEVNFLGNVYRVVENAAEERVNNPENHYLQKNEPTKAGGIASYKLINEENVIPFDFIIEHTECIEGGAEGYLKVRAVWDATLDDGATDEQIDAKNELDGKWGYDITAYEKANPTTSPIQFKLNISSYGDNRSSRFVLTQDISPENYGDYVDYSIDLNNDGNTKNDWRIFFEDNENIYIIAAGLVKNSKINSEITSVSTTGGCTTYGINIPAEKVLDTPIEQSIINKFMLTDAVKSDNINYKATSNLLSTEYWQQFVDSSIANVAVGGPTLEMFVKSWNQKYNGVEGYSEVSCWWNTIKQGYQVNSEKDEEYHIYLEGYNNASLYFPNHTGDSCHAYWIAAPSMRVYGDDIMTNIWKKAVYGIRLDNGYIGSGGIASGKDGIRPVVQLKSGIFGSYTLNGSGEKVWTLTTEKPVAE